MKNTDDEWDLFVDELWELQWTKIETPLTPELSNKLYELSVGNMDLAVRIFHAAQRELIGSLDERITEGVLEKGASIAIRASKPITEKLKRDHNITLLKRKEKQPSSPPPTQDDCNQVSASKTITESKGKLVTIPGDLSRPHHPEFADRLTALQYAEDLHSQINDIELIQRASEENEPLEVLSKAGLFCEDPLKMFS